MGKTLIVILLIGFLIRVINITVNTLYGDELTIALDAYSLLKTGHDQLGNFMPLTFPMGAGRSAGYVYGTVPFVALFGPTALGVRALSILSGLGIIILLYLFGRKSFGKKVGLLAAAVGAVSPWDISLSRGGFEAHFALFLVLLGVYLFTKARENPKFYIFSSISFGLTFHTYPTYKVSLLLFLPLLFWYAGGIKKILNSSRKYLLTAVFVFVILGGLALSQTFIGESETRFSNINIFSQDKIKDSIEQKINFERQITNLPQSIVKYFHNKPAEYAKVFIENYLQNFSMDFLLLHGDRNPRHNMATMGELYVVELILFIIGVLTFWQRDRRVILFLLLWLILAPIPTAIVDLPHSLRSSFMLPPLILLSALGLMTVLTYKSKAFLFLVIPLFIIQFVFFIQKLYFLAPNEYSNFWSYPAKLASEITNENKDRYDFVILSDRINDIEFAYPVYNKINPTFVIGQNRNKGMLAGYSLKQFNNVFIGAIPEGDLLNFINGIQGSVLYVGSKFEKDYLNDIENIEGLNKEIVLIMKRKP